MNIALSHASGAPSPRAAGRHPFGLMVVIGLHVLVAGALLTAHSMRTLPVDPPSVALLPEPTKPPTVVPKPEILPPPVTPPRQIYVEPTFKRDTDEPKVTTTEERLPTPIDTRPLLPPEEQRVALADTPHFTPRAGHLDANAEQCRPEYPANARRAGATGVSRIRFTIDSSGKVVNAQVLRPSGASRESRLLDQAAAAALSQCPVTVATDENGRAVASSQDVDYVWSLD